jgi:hypothetical protein
LVKSLREQPEVVERIRAQAIAAVAHEVVLEDATDHDPGDVDTTDEDEP